MTTGGAGRRGALHRRGDSGESTALETDVVRFVAIVGLTLMVIFALVHSLPYEGKEVTPAVEIVPREPPEADPNLVTVSRGELERMSRSEAELRHAERRLEESAASRRVAEQEVEALSVKVREVTTELTATRGELEETRDSLAAMEADDEAEEERFRAEIGDLREQVELLEDELRDAASEIVRAETSRVAADEAARPPGGAPPAGDERAGGADAPQTLVLRFRDDRVYLDLLERGKIASYLRIPELDLTYRVSREAPDRLGFSLVYGHDDGAVYEIPDGTVPDILRDETRRFDLRLSLRNDLDYLVVLSDAIHDQVARLEAEGEVGFYDILETERVVPAGGR